MRGSVLLPLFIMAAIASAERKKLTNDDFPEAVVNDKVQAPSFDEDDYAASSSCIATDDEDDNSKMASQRCLLFPIGANVEAVWVGDGNWYQAKVLQIWEPESPEFTVKYMVHYIGYSKAEDQIVSRHHVRALDASSWFEDEDDYDKEEEDDEGGGEEGEANDNGATTTTTTTTTTTLELEEEVDDIISRNDPIPIHHPRRRFLLFSSVGEQCLDTVERFWLRDTDDDGASKAEFDIVLVFYAQTTSSQVYDRLKEIAQKNRGFMTLIARKDFKWPNFRWWVFESGRVSRSHHDSTQLSEEGNGGSNTIRSSIKALKSKYEAIWVPDDDMRMSTTDINNLFHVVLRHPNILIASPSFTPTSEGVWRYHDVHQGANTLLRYTNFVENSAALLRPAVLEDEMFRRCLEAVISGCYLDFCFFAAVGYNDGDDDDDDDDDDNEEEDDDCVMVYHGIIISINEGTAASRQ